MLQWATFRWKERFCSLFPKGRASVNAVVQYTSACIVHWFVVTKPANFPGLYRGALVCGRRAKATDQALSLRFLSPLVRVVGWNLVANLIAVACM
jgi:hypothetical protein